MKTKKSGEPYLPQIISGKDDHESFFEIKVSKLQFATNKNWIFFKSNFCL